MSDKLTPFQETASLIKSLADAKGDDPAILKNYIDELGTELVNLRQYTDEWQQLSAAHTEQKKAYNALEEEWYQKRQAELAKSPDYDDLGDEYEFFNNPLQSKVLAIEAAQQRVYEQCERGLRYATNLYNQMHSYAPTISLEGDREHYSRLVDMAREAINLYASTLHFNQFLLPKKLVQYTEDSSGLVFKKIPISPRPPSPPTIIPEQMELTSYLKAFAAAIEESNRQDLSNYTDINLIEAISNAYVTYLESVPSWHEEVLKTKTRKEIEELELAIKSRTEFFVNFDAIAHSVLGKIAKLEPADRVDIGLQALKDHITNHYRIINANPGAEFLAFVILHEQITDAVQKGTVPANLAAVTQLKNIKKLFESAKNSIEPAHIEQYLSVLKEQHDESHGPSLG